MAAIRPRITGTGYAAPKTIRTNNDPIFDWIKQNQPKVNPFKGYKERRVLAKGEDLMTIMMPAALMALKNAGIKAADVDMLLGTGTIGRYVQPNDISLLHQKLKMRADAWVLPITNDFTNFHSAMMMADALIKAERAKTILICIGSNWTRNVDYHTMQSVSAGDGAAAVVVSASDDSSCFYFTDQCTLMATAYFGGMYTANTPVITSDNTVLAGGNEPAQGVFSPFPKNDKLYKPMGYDTLYSHHFYNINALGLQGYTKFATTQAVKTALALLKKNKLSSADISYFPHQSTQGLIDLWVAAIKPAQTLDTIQTYANLCSATEIFNFAYATIHNTIKKNNCLLMSVGSDVHCNSILLQREGA